MESIIEPTQKDFEFYSKYYIKNVQEKENDLLKWIRFTEKRLEELGGGTDTYVKQKERLEEYYKKLENVKTKLENSMDETNSEFMSYVIEQLTLKEKQLVNSKKKKEATQMKKDKQDDCIKKFRHRESSHSREDRFSEKLMNNYYDKMCRIDQEMPKYLREALENMPANKGYIYKGIWYFGHVPLERLDDNRYLTMFERVKGIQYIHEYYHDYPIKTYRLWEKLAKNTPKKLIRTEEYRMR